MSKFYRYYKLVIAALALYAIYTIRSYLLFEAFLNGSPISLLKLPESYRSALDRSMATGSVLEYDYALLPSANNTSNIPPTIHFIWFKDIYKEHLDRPDHETDIPHLGSGAPQSCLHNSPGFDVIVWNASAAHELLSTYYPTFLPTYESYRYPIQRVDAFKYFLLYHHGGVYMDLDIVCRRPLWPLLQYPAWFPKAELQGVNNDVFATRKGHPLLERMIHRLHDRDWNLILPYLTVYWSTGPSFASDILAEWWREWKTEKGEDNPDSVHILPAALYSSVSPYFGHHIGGTWHGEDVAVVLWLVDRPWVIILLFATILASALALALRRRGWIGLR